MKLYTFVVHNLQMCIKEYGCCPKFKRGDNSTYTFTKMMGMYLGQGDSDIPPIHAFGGIMN
jgi:hypothetical protein